MYADLNFKPKIKAPDLTVGENIQNWAMVKKIPDWRVAHEQALHKNKHAH